MVMALLKSVLVVIFSLQLSTYVFADSNETAALDALNSLDKQIRVAEYRILDAPALWSYYNESVLNRITDQLLKDIERFGVVLDSVTAFADDVINGRDCVEYISTIFDNIYNMAIDSIDIASEEYEVYIHLFSLAAIKATHVSKLYLRLVDDYDAYCYNNGTSTTICEDVSEGILLEVERLLQILERIPPEFFAEIHVLGYGLHRNWENIRVDLMMAFNNIAVNATTCLASKILNATEHETAQNGTKNKGDISNSFLKLVEKAANALQSTNYDLLAYLEKIVQQNEINYSNTVANIRNATYTANQTINSLLQIPKDLNITTNCTIPDLHFVVNSSVSRSFKEYRSLADVRDRIYLDTTDTLYSIFGEVEPIGVQTARCSGNTTCSYLSQKIATKTIEIPLSLEWQGNSTAVLLHQSLTAVVESGARIARDVLDELYVDIVSLKSCIQHSLY